jgi:predicted GH43/DUF377 family glycosyl hydrolase
MKISDLHTPYKHDALVIAPSYISGAFDSHAVDCPFPFFHDGSYWMTFVGWDSLGYRTGLAASDDLVRWEKQGLLIDRGPRGSFTEYNVALTHILRQNDLYSRGELKKVGGNYLGTYHAYPNPGYEIGPASIGLCYSPDLRKWEMAPPVLHPDPHCAWEAGGLYKSWIVEHKGTYYLFYNAKNQTTGPWFEQTGVAISQDLKHWERYSGNPVLHNGPRGAFDDLFCSDPCVLRCDDRWVMFYFGNCSDGHARDSAAVSDDLLNWEKIGEVLVDTGPEGSLDSTHAHKAGLISDGNRLYHFYCAVSPAQNQKMGEIEHNEVRGITFARNEIRTRRKI